MSNPEEQSHERDDEVDVRANEVCAGGVLGGTCQHQCPELSSDIVSAEDNRDRCKTIMRDHYRGAHDIFMVYDVMDKESFNIFVKVWMGEIDKHASGVNKLLIGNKCDLTSQKELSTDEAKELTDSLNMRLSETSGKNAHNVEEA